MRYGIALAGALLVFAVAGGSAQAATEAGGKYCLGPQANNCTFATLADCEKAKAGADNTCTPQAGATGIKEAASRATNTSK